MAVLFCVSGPTTVRAQAEAPPSPELVPETAPATATLATQRISERRIVLIPKGMDRTVVEDRIHVKVGDELNPQVVSDDIQRIFRLGFFENIQVTVDEGPEGPILTYYVQQRPMVDTVDLVGIDLDEDKQGQIESRALAQAGRFYDPNKVQRLVTLIRKAYEEDGHHFVDIDLRVEKRENNRVAVSINVDAGNKLTIRKINIVGNTVLSDEEIIQFLANQEAGPFSFMSDAGSFQSELLIQRDVEVIKQLYLSRGHVFVRIGRPRVTVLPDRSGIHIEIPVSEGQAYKVSAVDVAGDLIDPSSVILEKANLAPGQVFDVRVMIEDMKRIGDHYRDRGYAFADTSYDFLPDRATQTLKVVYKIQKGSLVDIGFIEVTGNKRTLDNVVRRELKIQEGDRYSESKLELSKAFIVRTGYFEPGPQGVQVRKIPRRLEDGTIVVDIDFHVREQRTGSFQLGVGFSSFESFMFNGQVSEQNFLGRGQTLMFNAMFSSLRTLFQFQFHDPYFFNEYVGFGVNGYNISEFFQSFERKRQGGSLTWSYRFTDYMNLSFTYRLEHAEAILGSESNRRTSPVARADRIGWTSSAQLRLSYDTRDNRMFPKTGQYSLIAFERADERIGSTANYNRVLAQSRWYFPFLFGTTFRLNGQYSVINTEDPEGVPTYERYFAGGIFDIRGFTRYSLGPSIQVANNREPGSSLREFVYGGNKKVVFNAEIEVPIIPSAQIAGVLFFDTGNAFAEGEFPTYETMRKSVGFGFRWWAPIGPLRFEWGFPLDRRPDEEEMVFEFTIGSAY
jgi:outer membrane protein insertion porin family